LFPLKDLIAAKKSFSRLQIMASRPIKNIMIAGVCIHVPAYVDISSSADISRQASGTIGAPILSALTASGLFNVSVLSRTESTATFSPGIIVKKVDFTSHSALVSALKGQDALICTLNDGAAALQAPLIEAAVEAGVRRFIPSEWGGSDVHSSVPEVEQFWMEKGRLWTC
jgi:hypothetical protein